MSISITGISALQVKLKSIAARAHALEGKRLVVPVEQRAAVKKAISAHVLRGEPLNLPEGAHIDDTAPASDSEAVLADIDLDAL